MATPTNKAKFLIVGNFGTVTSPSNNRGYVAAPGEAMQFKLEDTTGVQTVTWECYNSLDSNSPLATLNAPLFQFNGVTQKAITSTPPFSVNASAPVPDGVSDPTSNSWFIRCTAIVAGATHIFTRVVSVTAVGMRKPIPGETTENSTRGWADDIATLIEIVSGSRLTGSSNSERGYVAYQASDDGNAARFVAKKSRGTATTPASPAVPDALAEFVARTFLDPTWSDVGIFKFFKFTANSLRAKLSTYLHDGNSLQAVNNVVTASVFTTDATPTTAILIPVLNTNTIIYLRARWRGMDGANNMVFREASFAFKRGSGSTLTQIGSTVDDFPVFKDDAGAGTPGFTTSTSFVVLQVTGKASTTYGWYVDCSWREYT